ncbi:MAG: zinc ribbon domain-containing protein [Actinomycetota bacterium]|nr:zinc ribbon domain-containing protein [Actinomycetota bacterium]
MSTRVEVEDIQTTKSEKLLAWILVIFLATAGVWTYQKLDDVMKDRVADARVAPAVRAAIARGENARNLLFDANQTAARSLRQLELARETYRTELDAGRKAPEVAARYRTAQRRYAEAQREKRAAATALQEAIPAERLAHEREAKEFQRVHHRRELLAFLARAAFFGATLVLAYLLLAWTRGRGSRYFPVAIAFTGAAALMIVVLAGDYVTDYVNPLDYGALLLALFGVAVTLAAFWALQRYLARRVPHRRVRKHECPFCGYPVKDNKRCEGCGREVVAECATCHRPRRVGTRFCGACGAA